MSIFSEIEGLTDQGLARVIEKAQEIQSHRQAFRRSLRPGVTVLDREGVAVTIVAVNQKRGEVVVKYHDGSEGIRRIEKLSPVARPVPSPRVTTVRKCEANSQRGTGYGMCDAPLDSHGQCPRAGAHATPDMNFPR